MPQARGPVVCVLGGCDFSYNYNVSCAWIQKCSHVWGERLDYLPCRPFIAKIINRFLDGRKTQGCQKTLSVLRVEITEHRNLLFLRV